MLSSATVLMLTSTHKAAHIIAPYQVVLGQRVEKALKGKMK